MGLETPVGEVGPVGEGGGVDLGGGLVRVLGGGGVEGWRYLF